jgi:hypothetical protein
MEPVGSAETSPNHYLTTVITNPEELPICITSVFRTNENNESFVFLMKDIKCGAINVYLVSPFYFKA